MLTLLATRIILWTVWTSLDCARCKHPWSLPSSSDWKVSLIKAALHTGYLQRYWRVLPALISALSCFGNFSPYLTVPYHEAHMAGCLNVAHTGSYIHSDPLASEYKVILKSTQSKLQLSCETFHLCLIFIEIPILCFQHASGLKFLQKYNLDSVCICIKPRGKEATAI